VLDQPHHDGSMLYVPSGAPSLGEKVPIFVRVPRIWGATTVIVRSIYDGDPYIVRATVDRDHEDEHDVWWRADLNVHNPVTSYRFLLDGGPDGSAWLNGSGVWPHGVTDAADFRVTTFPPPPDWVADAVMYQIFPDRFARSQGAIPEVPPWAIAASWEDPVIHGGRETLRQLYGGDLLGIEERLDHLEKLGVNVLYLTPFFPAPSNHRYNASTFDHVDPLLGGDAALASLTRAAHRRGMRVLGDLTTNHSGDNHEWFRRAVADPSAEEAGFYYFGSHPEDYIAWYADSTLPKFNFGSALLRERLIQGPGSVVARWLRAPYRLDGWRIDVANMTGRYGADDFNHEIATTIRATVAAENPDALLLAEHAHDASQELLGDSWHATMNYSGFTHPVWTWLHQRGSQVSDFGRPGWVPSHTGVQAVRTMRDFAAAVPWRVTTTNVNLLGSHDTARIRTIAGSEDRTAVAVGLLFAYPGTPMLLMGDELGLQGIDGEQARSPMPWGDPERFNGRLAGVYRDLIALRRSQPALRHGGLRWAHISADAMVFLRETPTDRMLVLAARAQGPDIHLPATIARSVPRNLYGGAGASLSAGALVLPGDGPSFQLWSL
jgi:alpha-glucosidase